MSDLSGTVIDERYRLEAPIGSGGMGVVYRATQLTVARKVAVKLLRVEKAEADRAVARFQREAKALAAIQHPHIVSLIDFGRHSDGSLYLVMELLEGEPLSALIRREAPLPPERVVAIGLQVADALRVAHEAGLIHRDIKPSNIFMADYGRSDYAKLLDFGIAKSQRGAEATDASLTASGALVGSPRYMAPEQARHRPVTPASDLYSFGAVLYEMLTGGPLFRATSMADWVIANVMETPAPPTVQGDTLAGPLVDLIMRCLEKSPWNRPADAAQVLQLLEACQAGPVTVRAPVPGDTCSIDLTVDELGGPGLVLADPPSRPSHKPRGLALGAAVAAVAVGVLLVSVTSGGPAESPPERVSIAATKTKTEPPQPSPEPAAPAPAPAQAAPEPATLEPDANAAPDVAPDLMEAADGAADEVVEDTAEAEAAVAELVVRLDSDPTEATVVRAGHGELGRTPLEVRWAAGTEPPRLTLTRAGYLTRAQVLTPQHAATQNVTVKLRRKKKRKGASPSYVK